MLCYVARAEGKITQRTVGIDGSVEYAVCVSAPYKGRVTLVCEKDMLVHHSQVQWMSHGT